MVEKVLCHRLCWWSADHAQPGHALGRCELNIWMWTSCDYQIKTFYSPVCILRSTTTGKWPVVPYSAYAARHNMWPSLVTGWEMSRRTSWRQVCIMVCHLIVSYIYKAYVYDTMLQLILILPQNGMRARVYCVGGRDPDVFTLQNIDGVTASRSVATQFVSDPAAASKSINS